MSATEPSCIIKPARRTLALIGTAIMIVLISGCNDLLHCNLSMQARPLLRKTGATSAGVDRYRDLMTDPRFVAWFYQFDYVRGRRS